MPRSTTTLPKTSRRRQAFPIRRDVGLPDSLSSIIPACAQSCMVAFLQGEFVPSLCSSADDLQCLCRNTISSGYTLGEVALACTDSHCSAPSEDTKGEAYRVCDDQAGAVPATHSVLTLSTPTPASLIPSTTASPVVSSTPSTTSESTSTSVETAASAITDPTESTDGTTTSTKKKGLSSGAAAGISIVLILAVILIGVFIWWKRCHKKRKPDRRDSTQPEMEETRERDLDNPFDQEHTEDDTSMQHRPYDEEETRSEDELDHPQATTTDFTTGGQQNTYTMSGAIGATRGVEPGKSILKPQSQQRYRISNLTPDQAVKKPSPVELDSHEIMAEPDEQRQPTRTSSRSRMRKDSSRSERQPARTQQPLPFLSRPSMQPSVSDSDEDEDDGRPPMSQRLSSHRSAILTPVTPNFRNVKTSDLSPVSALDRNSMAPGSLPPVKSSDVNTLPSRSGLYQAVASMRPGQGSSSRPANERSSATTTRKTSIRFERPSEPERDADLRTLPSSRYQKFPQPPQPTYARAWPNGSPIAEEDEDLKPAPLQPTPRQSMAFEVEPQVPAFPPALKGRFQAATDVSSESGESRPDTVSQASDTESQQRRARSTSRSSSRTSSKDKTRKSSSKSSSSRTRERERDRDQDPERKVRRKKVAPSENGSVTSEASSVASAEAQAERAKRREERRALREERKLKSERSGSASSSRRRRRDAESEGSVISEASSTLSREDRIKRAERRAERSKERERERSKSRDGSGTTKSSSSSSGDKLKKSGSSSSSSSRKRKEAQANDDLYADGTNGPRVTLIEPLQPNVF